MTQLQFLNQPVTLMLQFRWLFLLRLVMLHLDITSTQRRKSPLRQTAAIFVYRIHDYLEKFLGEHLPVHREKAHSELANLVNILSNRWRIAEKKNSRVRRL